MTELQVDVRHRLALFVWRDPRRTRATHVGSIAARDLRSQNRPRTCGWRSEVGQSVDILENRFPSQSLTCTFFKEASISWFVLQGRSDKTGYSEIRYIRGPLRRLVDFYGSLTY